MIKAENRAGPSYLKVEISLSSGAAFDIEKSDIRGNSVQFTDASSDSSTFSIGYAAMKTLTFEIDNINDKYSQYDFNDASMVAYVENNGRNYRKGRFEVYEPTAKGTTITLVCYDTMYKTESEYDTGLSFPASLGDMLYECSVVNGFSLADTNFPNMDIMISEKPDVKTWRELIAYIAQCAGCVARFNVNDQLELKEYDRNAFDQDYDGGYYDQTLASKYESGDSLDGGDYTFSETTDYDGGGLSELSNYHHIYRFTDYEVATDDTVITGIAIKIEEEVYMYGTKDYVLQISDNPLITDENVSQVMQRLREAFIGLRFRKMSATCLSDFTMEACDPAYLTDRKGNSYQCYLTNISCKLNGFNTVSNAAETKKKNNSSGGDVVTKLLDLSDKQAEKRVSKYREQQEYFNELALNMFGMYYFTEELEDGSVIKYGANAPNIEDSTYAWKEGSEGFFISKDGGKTWIYGRDSNGNVVANILYAIGIQAEWIDARKLTVLNDDGVRTLYIDAEGNVEVNASSVKILDQKVTTEEDVNSCIDAKAGEISLSAERTALEKMSHDYAVNGDFSSGDLTNWSTNDSVNCSVIDHENFGIVCELTKTSSTSVRIYQTFSKLPVGQYILKFKAATTEEYKNMARLMLSFNSQIVYTSAGALSSDKMTEFRYEFEITAAGSKTLSIYPYVTNAPVYITDIELLCLYNYYCDAQLKIRDDAISAEVTRASGIEEELRAAIQVNADNITLRVSKGEMGSYITQYYNNVIVAFNNNSKYVQINPGEIAIYNNGVENSKKRAVFNESGNHFYRDNYYVGKIGTNQWSGNTAHKGLVFDLEYTGKYMAWTQEATEGASSYTTILCYSRANSIYTSAGLHLGCNLYGHNWQADGLDLRNSLANGYTTFTGSLPVVLSITGNSDGSMSWTYGNVIVKNGMITSIPT